MQTHTHTHAHICSKTPRMKQNDPFHIRTHALTPGYFCTAATERLRDCACVFVLLSSGALKTAAAAGVFHLRCHFFLTWGSLKRRQRKRKSERENKVASKCPLHCFCAQVCVCKREKGRERVRDGGRRERQQADGSWVQRLASNTPGSSGALTHT